MIFAYTLDKVLTTEKRQTRRIAKPNEKLCSQANLFGDQIYVRASGNRKVYEVGKSYAVQPNRGKKAVARIVITNIRREQVRSINEQDARAEGFSSREEFLAMWRTIHGNKGNLLRCVWVIEFELQSILWDDFNRFYEQRLSTNQSANYSYDLSAAIARIPRAGLYGWDNRGVRVGTALSY